MMLTESDLGQKNKFKDMTFHINVNLYTSASIMKIIWLNKYNISDQRKLAQYQRKADYLTMKYI